MKPMKESLFSVLLVALLLTLTIAGCGSEEPSGDTPPGGEGAETTAREIQSAEEANLPDSIATGEIPQPGLETRPVVIEGSGGEVRVEAEIADDDPERTRGLMAREELAESEGMLFVFDDEESLNFIMDNTLLPLSIAYIDAEGRIVDIQDMEPLSDETYPSAEPARYALEVNQGFFEERGVEVGDRAELPESAS